VNGAKKENIFIYTTSLTLSEGTTNTFFGNIFIESTTLIELQDFTLKGSLFTYSADINFNGGVNILAVPETQLSDYSFASNITLGSETFFSNDSTDTLITNNYCYNETTSFSGTILQGARVDYSSFKKDLNSLVDYFDTVSDKLNPSGTSTPQLSNYTVLPSNGGNMITLADNGSMQFNITFDASTFGESATFYINCLGTLNFNNNLTFELLNGAIYDNVFIVATKFLYAQGLHDLKGINLICRTEQSSITFTDNTFHARIFSQGNMNFFGDNTVLSEDYCFRKGTEISTPFGPKKVECLREGDVVYTTGAILKNSFHEHETLMATPIKFIGKSTSIVNNSSAPVRIPQHFFKEGTPHDDLYISRNHGIILDGTLIPAYKLIETHGLKQCFKDRFVTYYHIELKNHGAVLANGLQAESYLDNGHRSMMDAVVHKRKK
jgi:hypothetical protein